MSEAVVYLIKISGANIQYYLRLLGEKLPTVNGISLAHAHAVIGDGTFETTT